MVHGHALTCLVLCSTLLVVGCGAFYLPGIAPYDYAESEKVDLKVNKLTSVKTQLPYEYYWLPYCRPDRVRNVQENLGEILHGDRIENSNYTLFMQQDEACKVLCRKNVTDKDIERFIYAIKEDYRVNWIVDNLPGATRVYEERSALGEAQVTTQYERGFRVGFRGSERQHLHEDANTFFLHNHVRLLIDIHREEGSGHRIVGFQVEPFSIKHKVTDWNPENPTVDTCGKDNPAHHEMDHQSLKKTGNKQDIIFTYDVVWRDNPNIKWASRWDMYLMMHDDNIHWFSIVNSLMIVVFLTGMVAMIMMRTLHRDLNRYNQMETTEDAQEETGWKLVHGDVFRPPRHANVLSVLVGTGVQVFCMVLVTLIFAVLGFLSPANRGGLLTAILLLYVFMGVFAGYFSARLYKMFRGISWKKNTIMTSMLFPGAVFFVFFVLNFLIWGEKSSGSVPFSTMFSIIFLWFGISVPLVFLGSYFGFKKQPIEHPVRTNQIPRQIPEQAWYMQPIFSVLVGGVLPFGAVFIELFFILSSIWLNQFYYVFGFLFIVFLILIVTCAEITIVMCYFQLCSEDYHWWWRAFLTSGSSALYLFLYSSFYYSTKLEIESGTSTILYFGYMAILSLFFFMLTGTMGFYACFFFVRKIYASVKVD